MGLLSSLPNTIYAAFKGKLLVGQYYRQLNSGTLDELGYATAPYATLGACQGFTDMQADTFSGNTSSTVLVACIFAKSLPDGFIPRKDDLVEFRSQWYQFVDVKTNPAQALWTCKAFLTQIPILIEPSEELSETELGTVSVPRTSFKAILTSNTAITAATWTLIKCDSKVININNGYSSTAGNFAAPIAGAYLFNANMTFTAAGDTSRVTLKFYKNGVAQAETESVWFNDWENLRIQVQTPPTQFALNIGDIVDVRVYAETAGLTVEANSNQFIGSYVGALA